MDLQPGTILVEKYRLDHPLGQGAYAQVWLATHLQLNAPRALKILHRDAPGVGSTAFNDHRLRFQLEAQLGAQIEHPHVVRVYDFEEGEDQLLLVMEYAPGGSLQSRLDKSRQSRQLLPVDECLRIAQEVAEGLAAVHALDAVHRDLKPSNVLFDAQGRAKVADLGLAQIPGGPSLRAVISQGIPHPGTPGYMSPEQETSYGFLTPASDVYALGLILFEMLTGRMYRMVRPGTRARELREEVPEWLDELLQRMLAKEPEKRPWNGAYIVELLNRSVGGEDTVITATEKRGTSVALGSAVTPRGRVTRHRALATGSQQEPEPAENTQRMRILPPKISGTAYTRKWLTIVNDGPGVLKGAVSWNAGWLSAEPLNFEIEPGKSQEIAVVVDLKEVPRIAHAHLRLDTSIGTIRIPVTWLEAGWFQSLLKYELVALVLSVIPLGLLRMFAKENPWLWLPFSLYALCILVVPYLLYAHKM